MLYKRSSFLKYLKEKHDCESSPIKDTNVLVIKNGPVSCRMWVNPNDRIDYEEIVIVCGKLFVGLPGNSELIRIE
jgi:hypothetical protein